MHTPAEIAVGKETFRLLGWNPDNWDDLLEGEPETYIKAGMKIVDAYNALAASWPKPRPLEDVPAGTEHILGWDADTMVWEPFERCKEDNTWMDTWGDEPVNLLFFLPMPSAPEEK